MNNGISDASYIDLYLFLQKHLFCWHYSTDKICIVHYCWMLIWTFTTFSFSPFCTFHYFSSEWDPIHNSLCNVISDFSKSSKNCFVSTSTHSNPQDIHIVIQNVYHVVKNYYRLAIGFFLLSIVISYFIQKVNGTVSGIVVLYYLRPWPILWLFCYRDAIDHVHKFFSDITYNGCVIHEKKRIDMYLFVSYWLSMFWIGVSPHLCNFFSLVLRCVKIVTYQMMSSHFSG